MQVKFDCPRCGKRDSIAVVRYITPGIDHLSFIRCYGCGWESEDIEIKSPLTPYGNTVKVTR